MKFGLTVLTPKLSPKHVWHIAVLVVAVGLIAYAGFGFAQKYRTTHNGSPLPKPRQTIMVSTPRPDETKVLTTEKYDVPADQVRSISLPSIQSEGFVQRVGLDAQSAIAVPTNVHFAGWYVGSSRPGDKGLSLIDGHVQGKYAEGIFKRLGQLKPRTTFSVEFGDHTRRTFEVVSVTEYNAADVAKRMLVQSPDVANQLNLITCSGRYDTASSQYENRTLVIASLKP